MTGSVLLDIGIGLMFVYLSLSLIVTAAAELLNSLVNIRAQHLRRGIELLLDDRRLAKAFYAHPLISGLTTRRRWLRYGGREGGPSYIPREIFVAVLQDVLAEKYPNVARSDLAALIAALPANNSMERSISALMASAQTAVADAQAATGRWFDDAMERVSGNTKRFSQMATLGIGLILAVGLDVSTIELFRTLARDEVQRTAYREAAMAAVARGTPATNACLTERKAREAYTAAPAADRPVLDVKIAAECLDEVTRTALSDLPGVTLGWQRDPFADVLTGVRAVLGWILTALALSLGAPFWFDLLSKVVRIRGAGVKPETK